MPLEIHCQPDLTERKCSLRRMTTKICVDRLESNLRKRVFHQIGQARNFNTEISIGKLMCCCILV